MGVSMQNKTRPVQSEKPVSYNAKTKNDSAQRNQVRCYNCSAYGHYSIKCPQPQRKERCLNCNRTTHRTADCSSKQKPNVNKINNRAPERTSDLIKIITINGVDATAYIDSGSNNSLIRKSLAAKIGECIDCKFILKGFAGGEYISIQKVKVSLKIDNQTVETEMFLVEDELLTEDVLLGRDVICSEGKRTIIEGSNCWIQKVNTVKAMDDSYLGKTDQLQIILQKHHACFAENISELGKCNLTKMEIHLSSDKPVYTRPYRLAFPKRIIVANIVSDLLKNNIIRHSSSPYASGVVLIEKQNGEHRLCVD